MGGHSLPKRDVRSASVHPSISDITLHRRERRKGLRADLNGKLKT